MKRMHGPSLLLGLGVGLVLAALMGMVDIGMKIDSVDPYRADVMVCRAEEHELSCVNAHFQICNNQGVPNFDVLLAATLRWCAICQPVHGSAGFVAETGAGLQCKHTRGGAFAAQGHGTVGGQLLAESVG